MDLNELITEAEESAPEDYPAYRLQVHIPGLGVVPIVGADYDPDNEGAITLQIEPVAPQVTVAASGPHYVWSEDHTYLVAKDGEVDTSQPFFFAFDSAVAAPPSPESQPAPWPKGWTEIGATTDPGETR